MVEWLREVGMPAEYINKLARMFQDIKVSEDLNRQFKDQHKDSAMSGKSTRGLFCQLVHFCYNCTDILFQLYRYPLPTVQISSSNCTDILFQLYRYPLPTVQISSSNCTDILNIKVLNSGSWARSSERVPVSLPWELDDFIPDVEDFYKKKHCGRKLTWHHLMSNGVVGARNC